RPAAAPGTDLTGPATAPRAAAGPAGRAGRASAELRPGPLDDGPDVDARGQRAERQALVAGQPGGEERLGDRRVPVPDEQAALQRQRHGLDHPPGPGLDADDVAQVGP